MTNNRNNSKRTNLAILHETFYLILFFWLLSTFLDGFKFVFYRHNPGPYTIPSMIVIVAGTVTYALDRFLGKKWFNNYHADRVSSTTWFWNIVVFGPMMRGLIFLPYTCSIMFLMGPLYNNVIHTIDPTLFNNNSWTVIGGYWAIITLWTAVRNYYNVTFPDS